MCAKLQNTANRARASNHAYAVHELWMGACNIPAEWKVKRRACSGAVAMDGSVGETRSEVREEAILLFSCGIPSKSA